MMYVPYLHAKEESDRWIEEAEPAPAQYRMFREQNDPGLERSGA